jgi:uncharacterized protein
MRKQRTPERRRESGAAPAFELQTHAAIAEISAADWDRLAGAEAPPFLTYGWLEALERTGCVLPNRGWMPLHLSLHCEGRLIAVAPAYIKGNSEGEFVFDHAWARFARTALGTDYYPKLVLGVPFTPATGPRLLIDPAVDTTLVVGAFSEGISRVCGRLGISGAHVLFANAEQASALEREGLALRHGLQFHWHNAGYADFDDFLGRFDSKRRNVIRRERREMHDAGIEIETLTSDDLTSEVADLVYEFYVSTVNKYFWGRQYLNRAFFEEVFERMPDALHVVMARERSSGNPLGGAFNLLGPRALYGRYWGAREERRFLHFNVCFYHAIDDAIRRGLALFEPGAGGEHKLARGFEPTITYSAHQLLDPRLDAAVRDFLAREREAISEHIEDAKKESVLKPINGVKAGGST